MTKFDNISRDVMEASLNVIEDEVDKVASVLGNFGCPAAGVSVKRFAREYGAYEEQAQNQCLDLSVAQLVAFATFAVSELKARLVPEDNSPSDVIAA